MNIALVGYGRMGRAVEAVALERGHQVTARLDLGDDLGPRALTGAEVAIEFTQPDAVVANVRRIAESRVPHVVGTTGWYDHLDEVERIVSEAGTGFLYAPNFSLGVHVLFRMATHLARMVDALEEYDIHVQEAHHRHKVDHPSGTARRLAELVVGSVGRKERWAEGPAPGPADPATLWVSTTRAGEIPGSHVLAAEGPDDRIELRHDARSRAGFARGAVTAAEWIRGRSGVFTLDDVLEDLFQEDTP